MKDLLNKKIYQTCFCISIYLYFSFCYCSSGDCFCQYGGPNFGFTNDSDLYCCQKTKEKCDVYTTNLNENVYCNGEKLALTQQCNNACNFYGFDVNRIYGEIRSYLDICKDNQYELILVIISYQFYYQ